MELVVVRHAIAEGRDHARWPDDAERPLTPGGEDRFRRVARGLAGPVPSVETVLSSPFVRAWRTAEILAEEAGWPPPQAAEFLAADRSPQEAADGLGAHRGTDRLAVVGHEPLLSELVSLLLTGSATRAGIELKKGGVCLILLPEGPRPGRGVLRWLLPPKVLVRLAG